MCSRRFPRQGLLLLMASGLVLITVSALAFDAAGLLNDASVYMVLRCGVFLVFGLFAGLVVRWRGFVRKSLAILLLAITAVSAGVSGALEWIPTSDRKVFYLKYLRLRNAKELSSEVLAGLAALGAEWEQVDADMIRVWRIDGQETCDVIVITVEPPGGRILTVRFLGD